MSAGGDPGGPRCPVRCTGRAAAGTREARADSPSPLPQRVSAPASILTSSPAGWLTFSIISLPPTRPFLPALSASRPNPQPRPLPQTSSLPLSLCLSARPQTPPLPAASPPPAPSPPPHPISWPLRSPHPSAAGPGSPHLYPFLLLKAHPASPSWSLSPSSHPFCSQFLQYLSPWALSPSCPTPQDPDTPFLHQFLWLSTPPPLPRSPTPSSASLLFPPPYLLLLPQKERSDPMVALLSAAVAAASVLAHLPT